MASWERMEGAPGLPSMEKGFGPSKEKGKEGLVLPGVRSRGAEGGKGMFMGADLGMTSGLTGSSPEWGEGDLWSSLSRGLGDLGGEPPFWLPSSGFLPEVDKSWGWFLVSCPLTFSKEKCRN